MFTWIPEGMKEGMNTGNILKDHGSEFSRTDERQQSTDSNKIR